MSKKAIAITHREMPWRNVDFVKDCGLVPYLLHRDHGLDVTMATAAGGPWPYLELTKGLKTEILPDSDTETKMAYIAGRASDVDLLILYGITWDNLCVADTYKKSNPNGLIYCGLDINSDYADRIPFDEEPYRSFFSSVDLMGASCGRMTAFLNDKWPWEVACFRNGYYDFHEECGHKQLLGMHVPYAQRENVLLYTGRLRCEQKQSEQLLKAFAIAQDRIPDWKLRLVGDIDEDFTGVPEKLLLAFPVLKDRIEFVPNIEDRMLLHKEYERAKIFVTTSAYEGGVNNAMAEALCAGMVFGITQFDAYEDITGQGESGESVPVGQVTVFADMLARLCNRKDLASMSEAAYKRGEMLFDMKKIVGEIYGKLCDKGL